MFAFVAFDRPPCRRPGDAVGVENIPQFDERALRRLHRFGRRGGGCLHFGGPGMRRRRGFGGFGAGGTVSNSEISSCGFAGEALTRLCRTCPLACISSGGLSDKIFARAVFPLAWCRAPGQMQRKAGAVARERGDLGDGRCLGWDTPPVPWPNRRAGAREQRRGMAGLLPGERIEEKTAPSR